MSLSHLIIFGIIALIVIPPEKLPEVARQLARFYNDLKRNTSGIWDDLKQEASFKPEDLLRPTKKEEAESSSVAKSETNSNE